MVRLARTTLAETRIIDIFAHDQDGQAQRGAIVEDRAESRRPRLGQLGHSHARVGSIFSEVGFHVQTESSRAPTASSVDFRPQQRRASSC